ncbi:MAG: MBL fold metallo-hydrolase [Alphaproteobacteria bacterium]|nr:MBL fold metallo-hydrolase [Alphaproteobacteria bacterium]
MIFRQFFDSVTSSFSYLLAARPGGEALIIDPVLEQVDLYLRRLNELDLRLVKAMDTHVHADHVTGLGALRDQTQCITIMGEQSSADVVSMRVSDGDSIEIEGLALTALYTPGHTDDSYCYAMPDRIFTGDTLFVRGSGRTDFQHGDSRAAYDSLFNKVLARPDETLVYPGHDYKGESVSTIGEERAFNPRLQVASAEEYAAIMDNLDLPNPKLMDVAVPANQAIGLDQTGQQEGGSQADWALDVAAVKLAGANDDDLLVDLREAGERHKRGAIAGSLHLPYAALEGAVRRGGLLHYEAGQGKRLVFYWAFGERSTMAVKAAQAADLDSVGHLVGGLDAWLKAGESVEY